MSSLTTNDSPETGDPLTTPADLAAPAPSGDSMSMTGRQVEALVRVIEAGPAIRRRYQFFVWMQNHVHVLLPHVLAVCGSWQRQLWSPGRRGECARRQPCSLCRR